MNNILNNKPISSKGKSRINEIYPNLIIIKDEENKKHGRKV